MRILVVTPTYLPVIGGAETGIYELFKRIGRKHNVRILTRKLPSRTLALHAPAECSLVKDSPAVDRFLDLFTTAKLPLKDLLCRWIPPLSLSYIWAVRRAVQRFKPDLINIHNIFPGALALMYLQKYSSIPVVLSLVGRMDVFGCDNPLYPWHSKLMHRSVRMSAATTALTRYMVKELVDRANCQIIPYGADIERFSPEVDGNQLRCELGVAKDTPLLFTLQRLVSLKRVDVLIRAMLALKSSGQRACLIIGGKGPELQNLIALAEQLGISEMLRFPGFISEEALPRYFAAADLFLFSSKSETFGIVLAQALACGTPIVACNASCIDEVVHHENEGLLVSDMNEHSIATAVIRILRDSNLRHSLARQARLRAVREFDWEAIASRYEEVFLRCIGDKKGTA